MPRKELSYGEIFEGYREMKVKIVKFILVLLLVLFILLSLLIFLVSNIVAFKYLLILVIATTSSLLLYKISYRDSQWLQKLLWFLVTITILYTAKNLYVMQRGLYLDGGEIIWINGKLIEPKDKERFVLLLSRLKKVSAHVKSEPTYSLSFTAHGDFDPRHLHIFKDKRFVYQGCLLGLEGGLDLEGYRLTKEAARKLEKLNQKYRW